MNIGQFYLLYEISSKRSEFFSKDFSKNISRTQSYTSATISCMIKNDYLISTFESNDRRKHTLKLIPKGQKILDSVSHQVLPLLITIRLIIFTEKIFDQVKS